MESVQRLKILKKTPKLSKTERRDRRINRLKRIKRDKWLYFLLIPGVTLTLIFRYFPMYGAIIAFKNYNPMLGIISSPWVGFDHFKEFIQSPNFANLLGNTLKISLYGLLLGFFPPVLLALSLNQILNPKIKKKIQLILYAPNFISVVIIVGMLFLFLSANGPVNGLVEKFTGKSIMFMSNPSYFRSIYILSGIWQGMGWASILYTATLAGVSSDLYEAANIDGANILHKIWYIDLPALKPVMVINFILSAGNIMNVGYEKAYLMQTSMNIPTSEIISTYVYKIGLQSGNYAYSAAVGLFNMVINVVLLLLVNSITKKINDGEGL
ncbi:MAG: ABC transporter permease [Enterococcus italicus]|jgi:putative aldouronate transport system permease protein|uniref:ABC transporter, permease protein n=1 Tax=Enterococcus italicus (strain DSM 15952 / CCUG 50447 / LMG 22039 / TP 1.5) TaxID=888064 RepID=E6LI29_ENTI1|nr:ABC transporter permease subunit [Enterococcus italicus]EFU73145.1 ABC transporter, permease protein [Enterococcus italicus DSM 15952]